MRTATRATLIATTLITLAGCAQASGGIVPPTTTPATNAPPTLAPPMTTVAPTTTLPVTTPPTPTPTTTAVVPTTLAPTIAPPTTRSAEDEVRAARLAAGAAFVHCQVSPESCDFEAVAIPGGPNDQRARNFVAERLPTSLRVKDGAGSIRTVITKVDIQGDRATVWECQEDGLVVVDVRDPENPLDDIIFNDAIATEWIVSYMRLTSTGWRDWDGKETSKDVGVAECPK